MHRKESRIRRLVKRMLGIAFFTLAVALTASAAMLATAQPADAGMLKPAVTAAKSLRPVWDGRHPAVWTGRQPMCRARYAGRYGWARPGNLGQPFRVECVKDGPGFYGWNEIPAPRACSNPDLPSGDAMRTAAGQEYVCTDGTWVHVSHYGN